MKLYNQAKSYFFRVLKSPELYFNSVTAQQFPVVILQLNVWPEREVPL
jgi:hypothetical protein